MKDDSLNRREFLLGLTAAGFVLSGWPALAKEKNSNLIRKKVSSTGTWLPVIGMGTWITFNVGKDPKMRANCTEVLREFFKLGGGMIDSSPMYGSAEEVVGHCLSQLGNQKGLFSATKVWTSSASEGVKQVQRSQKFWGIKKFGLFQVHNLVGWEDHLKMLFAMKKRGELEHVGVTTSHGRRHGELEKLLKTQPIDFVQLTYNLEDREVENRLLPIAKERGIAVIANRPFQGGSLIDRLKRTSKPVPAWTKELGIRNWAQYLLKFVVSHPAVTCAIPATSKVAHMRENMGAMKGKLPSTKQRSQMVREIATLL